MVYYALRRITARADTFKRKILIKLNFVEKDLTPRNDVTSDCPPPLHAEAGFNATFRVFLSGSERTCGVIAST